MTAARAEVSVGAVVLDGDRLLLIKRGRGPAIGQWSVPGGRVEPGETLAAAVEREVREETGLKVDCGPFIGWVERISDDYHYLIMDFHASPAPQTGEAGRPDLVAGDDAAEAVWVPLDQLGRYELVAGMAAFLVDHGIIADPEQTA